MIPLIVVVLVVVLIIVAGHFSPNDNSSNSQYQYRVLNNQESSLNKVKSDKYLNLYTSYLLMSLKLFEGTVFEHAARRELLFLFHAIGEVALKHANKYNLEYTNTTSPHENGFFNKNESYKLYQDHKEIYDRVAQKEMPLLLWSFGQFPEPFKKDPIMKCIGAFGDLVVLDGNTDLYLTALDGALPLTSAENGARMMPIIFGGLVDLCKQYCGQIVSSTNR